MEELLKSCVSTMLNEVAAKHGVTPAVLIGGWLLGAVRENSTPSTVKTFDRSEVAKTLPRVNGRFGKKESAAVDSKPVKKKPAGSVRAKSGKSKTKSRSAKSLKPRTRKQLSKPETQTSSD